MKCTLFYSARIFSSSQFLHFNYTFNQPLFQRILIGQMYFQFEACWLEFLLEQKAHFEPRSHVHYLPLRFMAFNIHLLFCTHSTCCNLPSSQHSWCSKICITVFILRSLRNRSKRQNNSLKEEGKFPNPTTAILSSHTRYECDPKHLHLIISSFHRALLQ